MKCPLCDTENDVLAGCCSRCQMPLLVRECPACDALVGKSASQCPKCDGLLSSMAGPTRLTGHWRTVTPEAEAAASGETQRVNRLAKRVEQLESELAESRVAATPSQPAPLAASTRPRQRKAEPVKSDTASWVVLSGLLIAVAAGFVYQFQDPIRRQLETLPTRSVKAPSKPVVAVDAVPRRPATTPVAAVAAAEEVASTLAAQPETSERAGAGPSQAVRPANDAAVPEKAAVAAIPVPNADALDTATATMPEADKSVLDQQIMSVQAQPPPEETAITPVAEATPASALEAAVVPVPVLNPIAAYDCSSAAVKALGLCGATQ